MLSSFGKGFFPPQHFTPVRMEVGLFGDCSQFRPDRMTQKELRSRTGIICRNMSTSLKRTRHCACRAIPSLDIRLHILLQLGAYVSWNFDFCLKKTPNNAVMLKKKINCADFPGQRPAYEYSLTLWHYRILYALICRQPQNIMRPMCPILLSDVNDLKIIAHTNSLARLPF